MAPYRGKRKAAPAGGRGAPTELYLELSSCPTPPRPTHRQQLTKSAKKRASRADTTRDARRGELEGMPGKYAGIQDFGELIRLCTALDAHKIKTRELVDLYNRGKIGTPPTRIKEYVYGAPYRKDPSTYRIAPGAYKSLQADELSKKQIDDDSLLLGLEAEEYMLHFIVRVFRRKKGLTEREIKLWARAQVRQQYAIMRWYGRPSAT